MAPRIALKVNGHNVTERQIELLEAVLEEGSKTAAAKRLGISVPVAHRYISSIESGTCMKVIDATPAGTVLTEEGSYIVQKARELRMRVADDGKARFFCTPVTEELLTSALSTLRMDADLVISDDDMNIRALKGGLADMILLDDPVHLFDLEGYQWTDVGHMDMIHVDRGSSYVTYRYGAQRIAFMHLDAIGTEYTIEGEAWSLHELMNSGKSFFVDEILLVRERIRLRSATEPKVLRHMINAVYRSEREEVSKVLNEILKRRIQ